jgi:hypothetical protein
MRREEAFRGDSTYALPSMLSQDKELPDVSVGGLSGMSLVIDEGKTGKNLVAPNEQCRPVRP